MAKVFGRWLAYWFRDPLVGVANGLLRPLARLGGVDLCSEVGARTGVFFAVVLRGFPFRRADARARANLRRLRPDLSDAETDVMIRRMWRQMGRTLAEIFVMDRLWREGRVGVDGGRHLTSIAGPVLVAPLHMGNWEVVQLAVNGLGRSMDLLYQPPCNRFDHRLIAQARAGAGVGAFPAWPGGIRQLVRRLTTPPHAAVLYADDYLHGRVSAPWFGRQLGPVGGNLLILARLAVKTGAAILPAYALRTGGACFRVTFLEPFHMTATTSSGPVFEADLQRLNAIYERIVLANPDQWFWLPNYGELDQEHDAPRSMSGRLMEGDPVRAR